MSLTGGAKHRRRRSPRKSPKKGKVGSKKNPYPSKAKASRSQRKGSKFYKKKGRTYRFRHGGAVGGATKKRRH